MPPQSSGDAAAACSDHVGRRLGALPGRSERRLRIGGVQQFEERGTRQRRREHVALRLADAAFAQVLHLLEGLDPLGDDLHAHVAPEADQRLDDRGRIAFGADRIDEHLVDLDEVDAELEHVGEPAVPGADIVDPDMHAEPLQRGDHAARHGEVFERLALGDFEQHLVSAIGDPREDRADILDDRLVDEVARRQIEADLELRPCADRRAGLDTDAPHQGARQRDDQPGRLGERDELHRRHECPVGLAPAHQHFGADHARGREIDDRLVVGNELAVLDCALELIDRIAARTPGPEGNQRKDQCRARTRTDRRHHHEVGVAGEHARARHRCRDNDAETLGPELRDQRLVPAPRSRTARRCVLRSRCRPPWQASRSRRRAAGRRNARDQQIGRNRARRATSRPRSCGECAVRFRRPCRAG